MHGTTLSAPEIPAQVQGSMPHGVQPRKVGDISLALAKVLAVKHFSCDGALREPRKRLIYLHGGRPVRLIGLRPVEDRGAVATALGFKARFVDLATGGEFTLQLPFGSHTPPPPARRTRAAHYR